MALAELQTLTGTLLMADTERSRCGDADARRWRRAGRRVRVVDRLPPQKEAEAAPVVTVDVAPVLLSTIQRTIRADGVLYPRQQAAIVPKIAAPIQQSLRAARRARARRPAARSSSRTSDLAGAAAESRAAFDQARGELRDDGARRRCRRKLQKAELDARAAKDALDAQQAIYDSRQALFKEGAIAQKDVNDAQVESEPGAHPVRDRAEAPRRSAGLRAATRR